MYYFLIAYVLYVLCHYTYKLPHIFESKPQKIQCNYHIAFYYISSHPNAMHVTSNLVQHVNFYPLVQETSIKLCQVQNCIKTL
jgi:hypothetical protein